jgi:hypothetical protein
MAYAMNWVTGCPPCDDDCEKNNKMIRNHATYNVIIKRQTRQIGAPIPGWNIWISRTAMEQTKRAIIHPTPHQ